MYKMILSVFLFVFFVGCGSQSSAPSSLSSSDSFKNNPNNKEIFNFEKAYSQAKRSNYLLGDANYFFKDSFFVDHKPIVILTLGEDYNDPGVVFKDSAGNVISDPDQFFIQGTFDSSKEGVYTISYFLKDRGDYTAMEESSRAGLIRYVFVVKNTPPEIKTASGIDHIKVNLGEKFSLPKIVVYDREDGDSIKDSVKMTGSVDIFSPGEYKLDYFVTDKNGLSSSLSFTVLVVDNDDINATILEESADVDNIYFSDYFINSSGQDAFVYSFVNNHFISAKKRSFSSSFISFPYTLKYIGYEKNEDLLDINFYDSSDNVENTIHINKSVSLFSPFIVEDSDASCQIVGNYNSISLFGKNFNDVIKISCNNDYEAYLQKNVGVFLENKMSNETDSFDISDFTKDIVSNRFIINDSFHPHPLKKNIRNYEGEVLMHSDLLLKPPYNLSGEGITVGLVDGGRVRNTHIEFDGRVINDVNNNGEISDHATHIAGTIAAKGIDLNARGYAPKSHIVAINMNNKASHYAWNYLFDNYKIAISNNSYGSIGDGVYDYFSQQDDSAVHLNPYLISIIAAGNYREDSDLDYGMMGALALNKNSITVGAIDSDLKLSYFSSTGPVEGGRIKPDVVAKGVDVYSIGSNSDTEYRSMQGTSMSTPSVTGLVALLQEAFIKTTNHPMREDIIKSVLVQSARDLGRPGPDYEYGFGFPDAVVAADIILSMNSDKPLLIDGSILDHSVNTYHFSIDKITDFKASLSWVDPVLPVDWSVGVDGQLQTDLDLELIDSMGQVVYAFSLDPSDPEKIATSNQPNRVDVVEQIQTTLFPGDYVLKVKVHKMGSGCTDSSQSYALASNVYLGDVSTTFEKDIQIDEFETQLLKAIH